MKRLLFLGLSVCLLASGCVDSENPLSDPKTAKLDERLAGIWREVGKDHTTYYHIGQARGKLSKGVMLVVSVLHAKGEVSPLEYLAFPTVLGGKNYLNVIHLPERELGMVLEGKYDWSEISHYMILQYHVDGDKLSAWSMDAKAKTKAIKDGKIKGHLETNERMSESKFTDTTENLARFFTEAGDSLFSSEKPLQLERVNLDKKP